MEGGRVPVGGASWPGTFFLSLLGGVWLDGLWHWPQKLGEYLPIHIPAPLSVSAASPLGTDPSLLGPTSSPGSLSPHQPELLSLTNLFATLCFLA